MAQDIRVSEEESTYNRAMVLGLPYFDTSSRPDKPLYDLLTAGRIRQMRVVPLEADEYKIHFGITTTTSQKHIENLRQEFLNQRVSFSIISDMGLSDYINLYDPPEKIEYSDISITADDNLDAVQQISATLNIVRPDDMLAYIVQQAFKLDASDIHLESTPTGCRIRFRVHGVLHVVATLNIDKYRQLTSVLASAANISTSTVDDQTGQINREFAMATGENVTVNLRVEAVKAVEGMDMVLRLFNFEPEMLNIDRLDFSPHEEGIVRDIIKRPSGLVMIVGPTGSGKTTTLYSILNELNTSERKIITLEDPVEYRIDGITQIPVATRSGQSFAEKFRSVMRLDPDVIMVGEIRDIDTAKTALQAALTGHLVLSTYHASSAAAAVTRLLDAIGENPLYASAIRLIQAQRLVRRLDNDTKKQIEVKPEVEKYVREIVEAITADVDMSFLTEAKLCEPGKSPENPFGFDGQFAIRELLTMTPEMQKLLTRPSRELTTELIEKTAVEGGMLTMKQDGILCALKGDTSLEEVSRVVG